MTPTRRNTIDQAQPADLGALAAISSLPQAGVSRSPRSPNAVRADHRRGLSGSRPACALTCSARAACWAGTRLTSQVMQRQLGVDQPDFGFLLDEMIFESDRCVPADRFITPRVEPEGAFILQEDLAGPGLTIEDAAAAVGRIRRTGPGYPSRSAHYRCRCRRSHRHARRRRHRHRLRRHLGCSAHRERRKTRHGNKLSRRRG